MSTVILVRVIIRYTCYVYEHVFKECRYRQVLCKHHHHHRHPLQWRRNVRNGVSNHRCLECLLTHYDVSIMTTLPCHRALCLDTSEGMKENIPGTNCYDIYTMFREFRLKFCCTLFYILQLNLFDFSKLSNLVFVTKTWRGSYLNYSTLQSAQTAPSNTLKSWRDQGPFYVHVMDK